MMKNTIYIFFIGLLFSIIACKSLDGIRYSYIPLKYSLSLIPSNDSSSTLFYANSMPVAKWSYHKLMVDMKGRRLPMVKIDSIETLDTNLVEYLERRFSKSFEDEVVCKGDTALIVDNFVVVFKRDWYFRSQFYNLKKNRMRYGVINRIKN